jgi:hypothetical protein
VKRLVNTVQNDGLKGLVQSMEDMGVVDLSVFRSPEAEAIGISIEAAIDLSKVFKLKNNGRVVVKDDIDTYAKATGLGLKAGDRLARVDGYGTFLERAEWTTALTNEQFNDLMKFMNRAPRPLKLVISRKTTLNKGSAEKKSGKG